MVLGMLSILLDITACSREEAQMRAFCIEGKLVNVMDRQPVQDVTVEMQALKTDEAWTTLADASGNFRMVVTDSENQDYMIKIRDADYRIVNPNTQVNPYSSQRIWYLIPIGHQ